jgi:hypothetical protein
MSQINNVNIQDEKIKFHKTSASKYYPHLMYIEKKTIVFDFDETLAKVHFNKKELAHYDD